MKTKAQLVEWIANFYDNCGFNDYFGYEMSTDSFKKEIAKKKKWELKELIFNTSNEGQKFIGL